MIFSTVDWKMLACWEKWKILLDINQALELARGLHIIFSGRQSTVVNRIKNYTNIFIFGYKELNESEKKNYAVGKNILQWNLSTADTIETSK